MTNSDASEKSKGVVLFATNTETVDYESIAKKSARLIEHYLGLPTTILTGKETDNRRYSIDSNSFESWHNRGRHAAYELSPYDYTILLDCDYFVLDDNLLKVLSTLHDYKIVRHNQYVDNETIDRLGKYSVPSLWATIVAFEKSEKSKRLFDFVARIERNYAHYRKLYNITATNFRNDYAFTIADLVLNGYTQDATNYIPWSMLSIQKTIESLELRANKIYVRSANNAYVIPKQSLHIMSKAWLLSDQCDQFVKDAISA